MSGQGNNGQFVVSSQVRALSFTSVSTSNISSNGQSSRQQVEHEIPHSQEIRHAAHYRRTNALNPVRRVSPIQGLLKHYLERSRDARRAEENKTTNGSLPATNIFSLPVKIRKIIYSFLFVDAKLTYEPQGVVVSLEEQGKQFRRENMWTSILHVCSKIREEAIPVLIENLTIDAGLGRKDFGMLLTPATRLSVRQVCNFKPDYAVATFSNMKLWMWEMEGILSERYWTRFLALDSRAMFEKVLVIYKIDDLVSTGWLSQAWLNHGDISFLGKLKLGLCYLIDDVDQALLHLSSEADECNNAHDLIGHVYLNFVDRQAIFDMEDEMGEEACMKLII